MVPSSTGYRIQCQPQSSPEGQAGFPYTLSVLAAAQEASQNVPEGKVPSSCPLPQFPAYKGRPGPCY